MKKPDDRVTEADNGRIGEVPDPRPAVPASEADEHGVQADLPPRAELTRAAPPQRHHRPTLPPAETPQDTGEHAHRLFEDAPVPYQSLDAEAHVIHVNRAWLELFGYAYGEVSGRPIGDFLSPDSRERLPRQFTRLKKSGRLQGVEIEFLRRDGRSVLTAVEGRICRDRDGRFLRTQCLLFDITERNRAEGALRDSEMRLRNILDHSPALIFIKDLAGRYLFMNRQCAAVLNVDQRAAEGKTTHELLPPEIADVLVANDRWVVSTEQYRQVEETLPTQDGPHTFLSVQFPLRNAAGAIYASCGISTDITLRKRAEEALRNSQRMLDAAERLAHVGAGIYDGVTHRFRASAEWRRIHGTDASSMSRDELFRLAHPDDLPAIAAAFERSFQQGLPYQIQHRIIRGDDGTVRHIRAYGEPTREATGQIVEILGAAHDVTDAVAAEEALRASEQRYRTIVETAQEGIWVIDTNARTTFVNQAMSEMLGYTVPEMTSRLLFDFMDDEWRDRARAQFDRRRAGYADRHEFRFCRKDGSALWAWLSTSPVFGADGRFEGALAMISDITARKQADAELGLYRHRLEELVQQRTAELSASEARAQAILNSSADGLYGIDRDGKVIFINTAACDMLGYPPEQVLGQPVHPLFHSRHADGRPYPTEECPSLACLRTGQVSRIDHEVFRHRDGHAVPVMYANHPLVENDEIIGAVISFVDMSTQRAAEQARERALMAASQLARARKEFLSNMTHELRTPLNGVIGFAEIGHRHYDDGEKARQAFEKILQSGRLLLGVVNDILDFSKIDQGKLVVETITVDLCTLLQETLVPFEAAARAKGLALQVRTAPGLPQHCITDPLRLKQILTNLLSNAVKFTRPGSVTLSVWLESPYLIWTVSDTGIGMHQDQLERLFEPFEQADGSTTREFGGTGLGLAISGRLATLLGADLRVESRPGHGSTFELRLPYRASDGIPEELRSADRCGPSGSEGQGALAGLSILVAEDDEINQLVIEANLTDEGAHVVLVGNGRDAVTRITEDGAEAYDLVLMDIQMPEMDGYEATRRILALAPDLPVAGQTAHACEEERAKCFAAGMVAHLAKPVSAAHLVSVIREHAGRRRHARTSAANRADASAPPGPKTGHDGSCA